MRPTLTIRSVSAWSPIYAGLINMQSTCSSTLNHIIVILPMRPEQQRWRSGWRNIIKKAETIRRQDVKVMEIYAAKLAGSPNTLQSSTGSQSSPLGSWMELSLAVEEKQ